jgi:hypothetical protein
MTMTMQSSLTEVQASAGRLREVAGELVLIAVEDQPRDCDVHLVTVVHDAAMSVAAEAEQAASLVCGEELACGSATARSRAIAQCQQHVLATGATLARDLAAPELLSDLTALARERGGEVSAWVREVSRCIQACQVALWTDVQPALLGFWRELAEFTDRSSLRPAPDADVQ